jgi:hypothetical protein
MGIVSPQLSTSILKPANRRAPWSTSRTAEVRSGVTQHGNWSEVGGVGKGSPHQRWRRLRKSLLVCLPSLVNSVQNHPPHVLFRGPTVGGHSIQGSFPCPHSPQVGHLVHRARAAGCHVKRPHPWHEHKYRALIVRQDLHVHVYEGGECEEPGGTGL